MSPGSYRGKKPIAPEFEKTTFSPPEEGRARPQSSDVQEGPERLLGKMMAREGHTEPQRGRKALCWMPRAAARAEDMMGMAVRYQAF